MLTDLADVLRAAGLPVVEVAGWKTRGYNGWKIDGPFGGVAHHTGTPQKVTGNAPTLRVIIDGHATLPGPLSQLYLDRNGTWYVVAAGYCNHAGPTDDPDYSNQRAIGVEAEHPGGNQPWPKIQYDSYVKGCAALGKRYKLKWRGHKEVAVPAGRKVDPNFDMDKFRRDIAAATPGGIPVSIFDETVTYRDRKDGSGVTNRDMSFREWLTAHSNDETAAFFRTTDTRTRVIAMEKQLAAITKTLDALTKKVDALAKADGGDASGTYTGTLTVTKK